MQWLRKIFNRRGHDPTHSSTSFGTTFERLSAADDPVERAQMGKLFAVQLEGFLSNLSSNMSVALLEIDERQRQRQGETNEMIGEAVGLIRGTEAAVSGLRADFREVAETVSELESRLMAAEAKLADHDRSRDQSIQERRDLKQQNEDAQQERQRIEQKVDQLSSEIAQVLSFSFVEAFFDAVFAVDLDGTIAQVNASTELLFRCHREHLIGKPIETLVPDALRETHRGHREQYLLDPHPRRMGRGTFPAQRCDGTPMRVEVGLRPFTLGGRTCIIATVREALDQKAVNGDAKRP